MLSVAYRCTDVLRKYTIQPISYAAVPTLDIDWQSDCTVRLERYDCCMLHVTLVDEAVSSTADFIVETSERLMIYPTQSSDTGCVPQQV